MTQPQGVSLELDTVTAYVRAMDRVAEQLEAASTLAADHGLSQQRLTEDLGPIGSEFARAFTAAVSAQADALALGARLVTTYATTLRDYTSRVVDVDTATAAALTAAGSEI